MADTGFDYDRAFGGVARLYGKKGMEALEKAHVAVVGVGGVGSWAAEAVVRNAVGKVTLIDLDNVAESNMNRQLEATIPDLGKPKVTALAERFKEINPRCEVIEVEEFIDGENVGEIIGRDVSVVLDCIDQVRAKAALINYCVRNNIPVVTSGAAGGRQNPTLIQFGDLARITGDPLLSKVRHRLRKEYGFPKPASKGTNPKFNVTAVYSDEPVVRSQEECSIQTQGGLACAGYGSSVCVTASMGMSAAAEGLRQVIGNSQK